MVIDVEILKKVKEDESILIGKTKDIFNILKENKGNALFGAVSEVQRIFTKRNKE